MPLGTKVGLGLGDIVLDRNSAPPPSQRGTAARHFLAHAYCSQTAGWIRIPVGTEVGFGPGDIVMGTPLLPRKAAQ